MSVGVERPVVTVVVPMLNELGHIERCLEGFSQQTYETDRLDVVVVDGGSSDGSREVVDAFSATHPWCRVIDNPKRKASAAFNAGVDTARGEVLILFSAHGEPAPNYVERSVAVLKETGAAGVGGRYLHVGDDPVSSAIGLAMVSPFGMASPHRSVSERRAVDTISHPAYLTHVMREVGPFDETLERNSDYEFNYRMREAGHRLIVDPSIESIYRPRASLRALARQFWWYGRWKERVARRHPRSLRARHLAPPLAVLFAAASPLLATQSWGRRILALAAGSYAGLVATAVATVRPRAHRADPKVLMVCFPVMHGAWGAGFVLSAIEDTVKRGRR